MLDLTPLDKALKANANDWKLDRAVEKLGEGQPKDHVARLLWQAFAQGRPIAAQANYLWSQMVGAPDAWDAEAFERFIRALDESFPKAELGNRGASDWWSRDDIPGNTQWLQRMLASRKDDPAFGAAMQSRWGKLPEPWRLAIGFNLVTLGTLPLSELGAEERRRLARLHLRNNKGRYNIWSQRNPIPAEEWSALLADVARTEKELVFKEPEVVLDLIGHAPVSEVVAATLHTVHTWGIVEALTKLDALGQESIAAFEQLLPTLEVAKHPDGGNEQAWGHALFAFSYLRHCRKAGHTPPPSVDAYLGQVLDRWRMPWGGSHVERYHELMWDGLQALPTERREKLILAVKEWNWSWASACPTPAVLERVVAEVAALPAKLDYMQQHTVEKLMGKEANCDFQRGMLRPIIRELVPYATEALKAKKPAPQRQVFIWALAQSGLPASAEGLALALGDSAKGCRDLAREALLQLPPEAVKQALEPMLQSKRKAARDEAAQVLAALPKGKR